MTRRFDDTTRAIYNWFRDRELADPGKFYDREHVLIELRDLIPPPVATRFSEQHSKAYHDSLSLSEQVRRGRRNKLITTFNSMVRGGHLEERKDANDGKVYLRMEPVKFYKDNDLTPPSSVQIPTAVPTVIAHPVQPVQVEATQLYQISKSDVANQFKITDILVDGMPKIRIEFNNVVWEMTASAADHFCDRVGSQLIYARGAFAERQTLTGTP